MSALIALIEAIMPAGNALDRQMARMIPNLLAYPVVDLHDYYLRHLPSCDREGTRNGFSLLSGGAITSMSLHGARFL